MTIRITGPEVLEWALEIERNGEIVYNAVAAASADPEVKALFEDLAAQEKVHAATFRRMLEASPADGLPISLDYEEYEAYLHAILDARLFTGPEKGLAMAKGAEDRETALRAAVGMEKDALLFFYDLRETVGEGERETVSDIIREEKAHLHRLVKVLKGIPTET
jgi:rubrerythrin